MICVYSRFIAQLLSMGIFAVGLSTGCQLSTNSGPCQQGWYQVEHTCILMPNTSVVKHLSASDGCKHLGGKLLMDTSSDRVKGCAASLVKGQNSTEFFIDIVDRKSQKCGTIDLTSQMRRTVKCNQTLTTPRRYVCERPYRSSMTTPTTQVLTPKNAITVQTNSTTENFATKDTTCPGGFERIHRGCYKFVNEELDWEEAFTNCKETNGDLAVILSLKKRDDVQKHLSSHYQGVHSWWMGFKREANTDWAWLDGSAVDPNIIPWNNPALRNMKRELCGTIETKDSKFQMSGARCSGVKSFICEYHAITPRPILSSTTKEIPISDALHTTDTTFKRRIQAEVRTNDPPEWLSTYVPSTATATRVDVKGTRTSKVSSTTQQTELVNEPAMETDDQNATSTLTTDAVPTTEGSFFCEQEKNPVTFNKTRGGVTVTVPCHHNYDGFITRICDYHTKSWTPLNLYNCTRRKLKIASDSAIGLKKESRETLGERINNISSEVTSALESDTTIVSGEIKLIVNILEQIGEASTKLDVSNETLQNLATITDKLIAADTSTWNELSSANKTENAGSRLLKAMDDITSDFLKSENVTDTLIVKENIVINIASTRDNITFPKSDHATYSTNQTSNKIFLSSDALKGSVTYSVIIYTNVSDKFKVYSSSHEESKQQRIGSDVIAFSLNMESTNLSSPLILTFKTGKLRHGAVCSFLDTKNKISGVWSSQGCKTFLREDTVDCQCSHLTNFAVLMSVKESQSNHHAILSYVSVIGISISLFCLCLTVTVYSVMWRYVKSDRSVLHINLCACLMLGYTVFLGGISTTEHRIACAVAAALLHYLFLAVFFVMLAQGLLILKSVTSVSSTSILRYLYVLMYGAPLVIVATSLGITGGEGFGTERSCWLSPHNGALWAFVGPAFSILVVNFFILFAVIRIMQKSRTMTDKNVKRKTKSVVRSIFVLSPILGVTWALGVLSVTVDLAIFQYSFAICNSLQGLFIFIFQCVLQYQIKDGFRALLRRYRATSFDSSQRMTSTGQSQEKGKSESGQKMTSVTNTSGSYKSNE